MKGYIYRFHIEEDSLEDLASSVLNENMISIVEDTDDYHLEPEIARFKERGRVFSDEGEIRLKKTDNGYEVILLTEKEIEQFRANLVCECDVMKIDGKDSTDFLLYSLKDKTINPKFDVLPGGHKNKIEAYIYARDGVPLTIRIKGLR